MPSKQQDAVPAHISPVLFLTVEGEPMSFYLRPGPAKRDLQPLIRAGGGVLCGVQKPGAILLTDPEEKGAIPAQSAHWYVSTQYIRDCVEKDEQLELEDYRLNPDKVQGGSPKPKPSKASSPLLTTGRSCYAPEEDAAILKYVSKHKGEVGGNRLWQQMEKQRVTSHSWQSMKSRYKGHLAQRMAQFEKSEAGAIEEEKDGDTNQAAAEQKSCEETATQPETADNPPTNSSETQVDITAETDAQNMSTPAQSAKQENQPFPISDSSQGDETNAIPPTDEQQVCGDPGAGTAEAAPPAAEAPTQSADPEPDRSQSLSEESPSEQLFGSPAPKKSRQKEADAPTEIRTRRRSLRHQPEPEEPYGKKLRSAIVEKPPASPVTPRRSNPPRKSAHRRDAAVEEQPPKRARGRSSAPESPQLERSQLGSQQLESAEPESQQLESQPLESSQSQGQQLESSQLESQQLEGEQLESQQLEGEELESTQLEGQQLESMQLESQQLECEEVQSEEVEAEGRDVPAPVERGTKKTEKRKLGIFELATKEFDDSEDEAQNLQSSAAPAEPQPASSEEEPHCSSGSTAAVALTQKDPQPEPEPEPEPEPQPGPSLQQPLPEARTLRGHRSPCRTEQDWQQEESQSILSTEAAGKTHTPANQGQELLPTQIQLEEDKQRITELMKQSKQDLDSVVKALLKTSGDFPAALALLQDPSSFSGPIWSRHDDELLMSGDRKVHQQLLEEFGEEGVAKRRRFLDEGSV